MAEFIFWLSAFIIFYVYFGYPLLIALLSLFKSSPEQNDDPAYQPMVSVLIAAFNEEQEIGATIQNKIEQDYPSDRLEIIVVSDESSDGTDQIVESFADAKVPVRLVRQVPRQGKTAGLNLIAPEAKGEILVFSDANSIYDKDAIRYLVRNFNNPEVGYVTGKMIYVDENNSVVGDGCSAYMKYENKIRSWETRVNSVIGVDGGIDAMRAELYQQLNPDQLPDFVQPLKVVEQGYKIKYEEKAMLKEHVVDDPAQEYRMRVRVSLRSYWALYDMAFLMSPVRHSMFAFQLVSHKLLRYLVFLALIIVFVANLVLSETSSLYVAMLLTQLGFYAFAAGGYLQRRRDNTPAFLKIPYYFCLLNMASAHAFVKFLCREKQVIWKPRVG